MDVEKILFNKIKILFKITSLKYKKKLQASLSQPKFLLKSLN